MQNTQGSREKERSQIQTLADSMNCHFGFDDCKDAFIEGKAGNIHVDGVGYAVFVCLETSRQLFFALKALKPFMKVRQLGDTKAVLRLAKLPTTEQAEIIRDYLRVNKIREYAPEVLARLRQNALLNIAGR